MASRIGPDVRISGAITASEDLTIAGIVEGSVTVLGALTIERGAQIDGEVCARDVVLHGELRVPLRATASVRLGPTAVLLGDLQAARLIIEEGAVLEGNVRTGRGAEALLPAAPVRAALKTPPMPERSEVASPRAVPQVAAPRRAERIERGERVERGERNDRAERSERHDRSIPELPSLGRQKLVRR